MDARLGRRSIQTHTGIDTNRQIWVSFLFLFFFFLLLSIYLPIVNIQDKTEAACAGPSYLLATVLFSLNGCDPTIIQAIFKNEFSDLLSYGHTGIPVG